MLTNSAKDIALKAVFGRTLYVGLARSDKLEEETDANYKRQLVEFGSPQGSGTRFVANTGEIRFPPWASPADSELRFWVLYSRETGGDVVAADRLLEPQQPRQDGEVYFRAGALRASIP